MPNLLYYLPDITLFVTAWLLLDLFGSGIFRLLVRPRARRNWELAQLPQPTPSSSQPSLWLNYLQQVGPHAAEPTPHLRLKMKGVLRNKANGQWHPAECRAFFTISPLSMVWYADITRAFMVSVKATEQYTQAQAFSTRWLLSTFPFRWVQASGAQNLVQRNVFYSLAGAVWQPQWWGYAGLEFDREEQGSLRFRYSHQNLSLWIKAGINANQELEELSLWSENGQEWLAGLRFSNYRVVEEQKMPFRVEVLQKNAAGVIFVQADLDITDVVQKGKYAWW